MKYEIPEADVYSFDIFDTLITRKTALPCGIFRLIQEKLENGVGTFSADFIKNFFQIRAHIENFIRINFSASQIKQDLSFDDIYQRMASNYHLTKDEREYLQKIELETEIENAIPIQENIEYLKSKYKEGKKIILISDMYLPAETLKKILLSFDSVFQNIPVYVSGDIGASKYYGDLFDAVAFKEKITDRKKWIHIGDNKYADVKVPESKGIRTWHFNYPDLKPYEAEYIYNNPTDTAAQFLIGQSRLSRLFSSDKSEAFDIAVSYAAPLLYQYVDFIVKETLHRGIRNLYFLARDGFILKIIADEIIKIRNLKIRTHYFYGSRKSLRCPNKDRIEDFLKTSLMETEVLLSVKDKKFFHIFSLFSNIPKSLLEKFFLNGKELKKNILSADFQQACLAYFEKKADLVQRYIKQEVLTDESFAFVDLEGSGRTVNLLAQNMGRSFPCFYYMLVPPAKCFDAFEPIVFSHRVEAYAQPLELLCRHFEGQCLGYHEEGNKIVPVLDTDMKEDFQKCSWDNYLYGIETFTKRFSRFVAEDIITFIPSFPLAWRYFDWLCNSPNKKMADFLGEIPYTNLGAEKNKKAAPPFSINSRLKFLEKQRKGKQSEFTCFPFLSIARTPRSIMRISDAINLTVNFISRLLFVEKSEERKKIYVFGIRILSVKRRKCCV